ncbi:MAG: hypothetical protein WA418_32760 [Bradyrhizobium sp.]
MMARNDTMTMVTLTANESVLAAMVAATAVVRLGERVSVALW